MSISQLKNSALEGAEDVYDDGHLRVEHDNYYVAWGDRKPFNPVSLRV